jgi:hypothetical protein
MNHTVKIALPALAAVVAVAGTGALPIPGAVDQPPWVAIAVLAVIGCASAAFGGFSLRGWLVLVGGVLLGMAVSVLVAASLADTYTFTDWFVSRDGWVGALSLSLLEIIAAAGAGYVVGGLTIARRRAGPARPVTARSVATIAAAAIGSLLAAPALAFGLSATVVHDDLLAPLNQDMADISVLEDGSLHVSPGVLRAGPNWYMFSNASDRHVSLVLVPVDDDADVERLLAGDQQGFTFNFVTDAAAGQEPTLGRIQLEPGRFAIYSSPLAANEEGGVPSSEPIDPASLVVIDAGE